MSNLYYTNLAIEELEITSINNEIVQQHDVISDALVNSVYIDNIQNVVSESYVSKIELSGTAMRCINLAIESICQNLGANSNKYINTLSVECYSSENYKTVALEDMSIFIKELWVKIKNSINDLWEKVNEFWNNHFSSLVKIKSVLETALKDVNEKYNVTNIRLSDKTDIHILNSFNNGKDIDAKTLEAFITTHYHLFNTIDELVKHTKHFNKFASNLNQSDFDTKVDYILENLTKNFLGRIFKLGTDSLPLITGEYKTIEYVRAENDSDLTLMYDTDKVDNVEDRKIYVIDKQHLKTFIVKTLDIIAHTIKLKEIQDNLQKEFEQLTSIYDKHIEKNSLVIDYDDITNNKSALMLNYKKTIRMVYRVNSSIPKIFGSVILSNVKLARSVVNYSHFCLAHST